MAATKYQCEKCRGLYDSESDAVECEKYHPDASKFSIANVSFKPVSNYYGPRRTQVAIIPETLRVKWGDGHGEFATYVLDHIGYRGL